MASKLFAELWLPGAPEQVFPFFADARNLEVITPPWLHFAILTPAPIEMRVGTRIDYRLRLRGVPVKWQTEITAWEPGVQFRDEQRRGPYRRWVHTHTFERCRGGTLCRDEVEFEAPGGVVLERLLVRRDVRAIFEFRQRALAARFGHGAAQEPAGVPLARVWFADIAEPLPLSLAS